MSMKLYARLNNFYSLIPLSPNIALSLGAQKRMKKVRFEKKTRLNIPKIHPKSQNLKTMLPQTLQSSRQRSHNQRKFQNI